MANNLRDLGGNPFPYIILIVLRSLPTEVIKGEHFVLVDLFKLVPGSSSQVVSPQEGQVEAAKGVLVRPTRVTPPQSPRPTPRLVKKRKESRARQTKTAGAGLEDLVDWTGVVANEPAEEEEMSSLAVGFASQMHKQRASSEGEATSISGGKRSRRPSQNEEAKKDWPTVSVEFHDRASSDQPALEGSPNEAGATLEEGVPIAGPLDVDEIGDVAPPGVADAPVLPPRSVGARSSKKILPNQLLLSTYVSPLERIHPSTGMVAPDP